MQEAIPFRTWHHRPGRPSMTSNDLNTTAESRAILMKYGRKTDDDDDLKRITEENAVTVLIRRGCCLGVVVKCLLQGLGANPLVYEVEDKDLNGVVEELDEVDGGDRGKDGKLPAVFIGGRWFGGLERVMAAHITGELTPLLKQAGALWL